MDGYLPRIGDQNLSFLYVRGAKIHQNVNHEKNIYDKISIKKWIWFSIRLL